MRQQLQERFFRINQKTLSDEKADEMIKENDIDLLDDDYYNMMISILESRSKKIKENNSKYTDVYNIYNDLNKNYFNKNYIFSEVCGDFIQIRRVCKKCKEKYKISSVYEKTCPECGFSNEY